MPAFSTVYLPDTTALLVPMGATSIDVTVRRVTYHPVEMPGGSSYSVQEARASFARVSPRDWNPYTTFEPGDPAKGTFAVDVLADVGPAEGDSITQAVFPGGSSDDVTVTISVPGQPAHLLDPRQDRPFDVLIGRVWLANPRFLDDEHEDERAYLGNPAGSIDKHVADSTGEMNPAAPRYPFGHERISRYVLFSARNSQEPDRTLRALQQRLGADGPRWNAADLLAQIPNLWAGEL
ncbi:hypothetical protein [Nocardia sp. NPDC020380]|uniref:hypothetical protein n=1 Tax=Nocardia sp. NPDC020380 TaxID=3364309 RepID=UPI0037A856BE